MGRGGVNRVVHSAEVCMTCFNKMAPIIVKGMLGLCILMDCEVVKNAYSTRCVIFIIIKIIQHASTGHITHISKTKDDT